MKAATLESKFPILSVEHDCIISKDADITVCYRVELPELFTVTQAEYEAIHSAWAKAVKVLPNYSIVHKQDFFIEESYTPELQKEDLSFLSRSFERHFNERPYLKHYCYLFLTKTTKDVGVLACIHRPEDMGQELNLIVDHGGEVLDVIVEHPVYGQLTGQLQLRSRHDVAQFLKKAEGASPLSALTDGIHLHTVRCPEEETLARITAALKQEGFLLEE